jgi:hypothetical protein
MFGSACSLSAIETVVEAEECSAQPGAADPGRTGRRASSSSRWLTAWRPRGSAREKSPTRGGGCSWRRVTRWLAEWGRRRVGAEAVCGRDGTLSDGPSQTPQLPLGPSVEAPDAPSVCNEASVLARRSGAPTFVLRPLPRERSEASLCKRTRLAADAGREILRKDEPPRRCVGSSKACSV